MPDAKPNPLTGTSRRPLCTEAQKRAVVESIRASRATGQVHIPQPPAQAQIDARLHRSPPRPLPRRRRPLADGLAIGIIVASVLVTLLVILAAALSGPPAP